MPDIVCSYPGCMAFAQSRLPLIHEKKLEGEMPLCHDAKHMVWGGGECHDFGEMEEAKREEYLQNLEDTLKKKILEKMRLTGRDTG